MLLSSLAILFEPIAISAVVYVGVALELSWSSFIVFIVPVTTVYFCELYSVTLHHAGDAAIVPARTLTITAAATVLLARQ